MYKIDLFLEKLACVKGLSIQRKWQVIQELLKSEKKELSLTEIIAIAKIGDFRYLFEESWAEICAKQVDSLSKQSAVTCLDKRYPSQLLHLAAPPIALFYQGDLSLLERKMISVVGGRKTSVLAKKVVHHLLAPVVEAGVVIVSGCAKGIDTYAHQAAINYSGKTIAVIGTGMNKVYPEENRALQAEIGKNHLLLSEFPPDTGPKKYHFPMRNRLIAALSEGTCVIEAREKSGSLITAQHALELGKPIFSVPGNILTEHSKGSHQLIQDGAVCAVSGQDILAELKE
ncbi:DNA-protecting protein DprA [Enterococcus sp. VV15]|uniref:DNA-processing protein DprA n=1 Tax=Enterococcus sp. VV15 TaxID=2233541 RepID=UPI0010C1A930|nr:DNA-processing protein DprA [Enterococcus sp. VV15]TKN17072.1 DNA-protecting protein DprA [Enterococcus sp. VV15]